MNDTSNTRSHPLHTLMHDRAGGRMLDVGTRYGGFIAVLHETIGGITHTVGIDIALESLQKARSTIGGSGVSFTVASALGLPFADSTFDTVTMSNALHHLPDVQAGLAEMLRVLRPGGALIIAENITDAPTEAQASFIALHDLGGEIARHAGISHHRFHTAEEVRGLIGPLGLTGTRENTLLHSQVDHDPVSIQAAVDGFASHLADISGHPAYDRYRNGMAVAHLRATRTGIQRPAQLITVGVKGESV